MSRHARFVSAVAVTIWLALVTGCHLQDEAVTPKTAGVPGPATAVVKAPGESVPRATVVVAAQLRAPGPMMIVNIEKSPDDVSASEAVKRAVLRCGDVKCRIVHFRDCNVQTLADLNPSAIIMGGQKTPWWQYSDEELRGVIAMLRAAKVPILGICGGHQLIAKAFGGKVAPIQRVRPSEGYDGCVREKGWLSIHRVADDSLYADVPRNMRAWLNHCEEVKSLPPGFIILADGGKCHVQSMKSVQAAVYGVQFHPEVASEKNLDGQTILRNFLKLGQTSTR